MTKLSGGKFVEIISSSISHDHIIKCHILLTYLVAYHVTILSGGKPF